LRHLEIDVEPGSVHIASDFPCEIRMRTEPTVDLGIERLDPPTGSTSDGVGASG